MADTDVLTIEEDEVSEDYLSIRDAAAEYGIKSSAIRKSVREGGIATQPHRWGVRVRRSDVAHLTQTIASQPSGYATALPRTRVPRVPRQGSTVEDVDNQLDQHVLAVVGEVGPVTLAQLHEAMRLKFDLTFVSLVYSTRRLVANRLLRRRKEGKGDVYELRSLSLLGRDFRHSTSLLSPIPILIWHRRLLHYIIKPIAIQPPLTI